MTTLTDEDINIIYTNDIQNETSYAATFLENYKGTFDEILNTLQLQSTYVSKNSMRKLLHTNYNEQLIPFKKHILAVCYFKYGIEACNVLLKTYYDNVIDFYTLEIENEKTIAHFEHYRIHKSSMDLLSEMRQK